MSIQTFVSELQAANLLTQVRWRDGVYCPHCHTESPIRYGSYRIFQQYLCKGCDRMLNGQTGTVFVHLSDYTSKIPDEPTIRLLLADRLQKSLTVYTDGFRAYEPSDENDVFDREYIVHGEESTSMETPT